MSACLCETPAQRLERALNAGRDEPRGPCPVHEPERAGQMATQTDHDRRMALHDAAVARASRAAETISDAEAWIKAEMNGPQPPQSLAARIARDLRGDTY